MLSSTVIRRKRNGSNVYYLTSTELVSEEGDKTAVFGIMITGDEGIEHLEDIGCNKESVKKLFELLADEQASPLHLCDIVEDMLSDGIIV